MLFDSNAFLKSKKFNKGKLLRGIIEVNAQPHQVMLNREFWIRQKTMNLTRPNQIKQEIRRKQNKTKNFSGLHSVMHQTK